MAAASVAEVHCRSALQKCRFQNTGARLTGLLLNYDESKEYCNKIPIKDEYM